MSNKYMLTAGMTKDCAVCEQKTMHRYDGIQPFPRYTLKLWTCCECGATSSTKTMLHRHPSYASAEGDLLRGTGRF